MGVFGTAPADEAARRIATWIRRDRIEQIRIRDVRQKGWKGLRQEREIEGALEMLVAHRRLGTPIQLPSTAKGGRRSFAYPVNPRVHGD